MGSSSHVQFLRNVHHCAHGSRILDGDGILGSGRDFLSLAAPLSHFEFLVSVRCIVEPLPSGKDETNHQVLDKGRNIQSSQVSQVAFDQIRISILTQVVVVTIVVLNVPCFGEHPIKPVIESSPRGTNRKLESRPSVLVRMALFVTSVASVMSNHGPSGEGVQGQSHDSDGIHTEAHGQKSHSCETVRDKDHAVQMVHIIGSLFGLQLFAQSPDFFSESLKVKLANPFVALTELHIVQRLDWFASTAHDGEGGLQFQNLCKNASLWTL